ncbi:MAG: aminoacyltransferase [Atopobiaceae bacterium]|nr:aminoacyltransferase [Atopobiaceae bacterium]
MREFAFEDLSAEEFDSFSAVHPQGNFQQTSRMAEVRRKDGTEVQFVGVRENGSLVAATELEIHRGRLSTFAEIHDGPLCDLHDEELTSALFEELKKRSRSAGAAQLAITPELPFEVHDSFGASLPAADDAWPENVPAGVPTGADQAAFDAICALGFVHSGFDHDYNAVPRWRYVKDLTPYQSRKALLDSYAKNTRRNVRIAENSFVRVERVDRDGLSTFHDICELSAEKQGFDNRPLAYFEQLYDCLGDVATFYVAFFDARANLSSWEQKRDGFEADIARLEHNLAEGRSPERTERQLKDARSKLEASLKRIEEARAFISEDGEKIPAAAALFVDHPRERVYLFSGSDPKYAKFYAATAIQHRAMCDCLDKGITRYNFYGINGVFDDPADPGRGLLEFKQGFNGYVEEMMGSFTLPVKPLSYAIKQLAHKVLGR